MLQREKQQICRAIQGLKEAEVKLRENPKRRIAIYEYLADVYEVYLDLSVRRLAKKAARKLIKDLDLKIGENRHPVRVFIEASGSTEDPKQKSRWALAIRYVHGWMQPPSQLKECLDANGGISGCASKQRVNMGTQRYIPAANPLAPEGEMASDAVVVTASPETSVA